MSSRIWRRRREEGEESVEKAQTAQGMLPVVHTHARNGPLPLPPPRPPLESPWPQCQQPLCFQAVQVGIVPSNVKPANGNVKLTLHDFGSVNRSSAHHPSRGLSGEVSS